MSRRIRTFARQGTGGGGVDTYFDRVIKYIPADIIGAWVAATGITKDREDIPVAAVLWVAFIVGIILTPLWTLKQTREQHAPPAYMQAAISTVAFVVWVFALGGPFATLRFYHEVYGSLVLIGFTLIAGLVVPQPTA